MTFSQKGKIGSVREERKIIKRNGKQKEEKMNRKIKDKRGKVGEQRRVYY